MGVFQLLLLFLVVGGIWFWRRSRPSGADAASEYSKKTDGLFEVFTVRPAKPPEYGVFVYVGILLLLFGAFAFLGSFGTRTFATPEQEHAYRATHRNGDGNGEAGLGLLLLLLGGGSFWLGSTIDYRPRPHRVQRTFRVSPAGVVVDGREFKRDDIHRLIIKNGMSGNQVYESYGATPVIEVSAAAAENIAQRSKNAAVCHSLDLETGGKAYLLAGGMDQTTVNGLMHDVSSVLKFSKS